MADPQLGTRFGTGYVETTVTAADDDRYVWERVPGADNPAGFRMPPAWLPSRLAGLPARPVEFLLPSAAAPGRMAWRAAGATTLADLIRLDPAAPVVREGVQAVAGALGALHTALATGDELPDGPPPGLVRLEQWLAAGTGPRAAAPWRAHLRGRLGPARWQQLCERAIHLLDACRQAPAAVHGWLSLGSFVTDGTPGRVQVLTGTDVGRGVPEADLGCLLGELTEYAFRAEHFGVDPVPFQHLAHLTRAVHAAPLDDDLLDVATVTRITLHATDYASYVGWDDDLDLYPPMIATLLDQLSRP